MVGASKLMLLIVYLPIMILISYYTKGAYFKETDLIQNQKIRKKLFVKYLVMGIFFEIAALLLLILIFKVAGWPIP